jgi:hypothetical protein
MNVDVDRLAITLAGTSATLGREVADRLAETLHTTLARQLDLGRLQLTELDRLDLGAIDAPAKADAATIARLIATRLGEWLGAHDHDHGAPPKEKR